MVEDADGPRPAHPPEGRLLRPADRQRARAVELRPDQSGAAPRDARVERREPRARHAHARRGHQGRRRRPQDPPVRRRRLQARREPRHHARQGHPPERPLPAHPVRRRRPRTVLERPLLIVPPWINKFYILDLTPEKSFIRWCVEQGHTVFVISWVNPDKRHAAEELRALHARGHHRGASTSSLKATGADERQRRRLLRRRHAARRSRLAYMAATGDDRIKSATFFATQVDFSNAGDLKVFVDEEQIADLEIQDEDARLSRGHEDGERPSTCCAPNDLIWPYVIGNYFKGKEPPPFDLLYWNSDATRMPAANHAFYLRNCYLENQLAAGDDGDRRRHARPQEGEDPDLQSRHPRGPHRPAALGLLRLVLLRRQGDVRRSPAPATSPASSTRRRGRSTSTGPARRRRATATTTG